MPRNSSLAQNTTVSDNRKGKQKTSRGGGAIRRSVSSSSTLKPFSATPGSRPSYGGHSSTPTMPDVSGDFPAGTGPDVSAIGPAPILSKLMVITLMSRSTVLTPLKSKSNAKPSESRILRKRALLVCLFYLCWQPDWVMTATAKYFHCVSRTFKIQN